MDIEIVNQNKNEIELRIKNEDIAFFNLVVNLANSKKETEFAAIKKADNLEKEFSLYIRSSGKAAKDILLTCVSEAEESLLNIVSDLKKSLPK
jgi:DNA-directed RNA polymerase subunit L